MTTVKNQPVAITLVGSDPDGDDLTYQIVDAPAQGTLSGGDNLFTYAPGTDFVGQQTFTYRINDSALDSNLATVTIIVQDIDLAITGVDVSQTTFDPNTMAVSGNVTVTWKNAGAMPVAESYAARVYVEDQTNNTKIDHRHRTAPGYRQTGCHYQRDAAEYNPRQPGDDYHHHSRRLRHHRGNADD